TRESGNGNGFNAPLQFIPDYWYGGPSRAFYGQYIYYWNLSPHGDPTTAQQIAYDYVVVVLSENPGLGWFGSKTYSTSWNGANYWYEQGYAADDGGTNYPYAQGPFAVAKEFS